MRIPRIPTIIASLVILAGILSAAYVVSRPSGPAVTDASFGSPSISPNADGDDDITIVSYRVRREVRLSIYFEDAAGQRYYFRHDEIRTPGDYSVAFSGIVEGYALEAEDVKSEVVARLLPDGDYTWVMDFADQAGTPDKVTGYLTIAGADPVLPDILDFSISPEVFTPNQDGLSDRVTISTSLPKAATLTVYLIDQSGKQYFVPEAQKARKPGEAGRHDFDYDGGVDLGVSPPPDGTYTVLVEAKDEEGQHTRRTGQVTIKEGGVPLAEIVGQPVGDTVVYSSEFVRIGDVLSFELTVENYGEAPIRTTGPKPGYVYNQDETYPDTGFYVESGAWRVGIDCDTCGKDYSWRWALGTVEDLTPIEDNEGHVHYYLMPGQRTVVRGGIRILDVVPSRNPQQFWAGLIHEDVAIAPINEAVDPHWIEIELDDELLLTPSPTPKP